MHNMNTLNNNEEKKARIAKERELVLSKAQNSLSTIFYFNLEETYKHERPIRTLQRGAKLELDNRRDEIIVKYGLHIIGKIPKDFIQEISESLMRSHSYQVTVLNILGRDGMDYQTTTVIDNNEEKILKHLGVEILIEFPMA